MFSIETFVERYEIKKSKTNHNVPVINGIHLHSMYNPIKEAEDLIFSHEEGLRKSPFALVLGLGMGHHLPILEDCLVKYHKKNIEISVIDPNRNVFNDYLKTTKFENDHKKIHYFIDDNVDSLYGSEKLVKFLTKIPTVIVHTPSFNLYSDFYKAFLSYTAPTSIHEYVHKISDSSLKKHLYSTLSDNPKMDLSLYIESLKNSTRDLKKYDYILIATKEIV